MSIMVTIREYKNKDGNVVKLQINYQSHYESNFGLDSTRHFMLVDKDDGTNLFVLASLNSPQILDSKVCEEYNCKFGLGVRGYDTSKDDICIEIPKDIDKEWFNLMHKAVTEYNRCGKACSNCVVRHCNSCGIIEQFISE